MDTPELQIHPLRLAKAPRTTRVRPALATFYAIVGAVMVLDLLVLGFLVWAFNAPRFRGARLSLEPTMKVSAAARIRNILTSSTLSLLIVLGLTWLLYDRLLHEEATPWWTMALQAVGILVVYDFTYYALHRGMHHKKVMRWVHGVHHRVRNPSAVESFYLHPAELLAGLLLLVASTWIVGPVHIYAFGAAFLVYSTLMLTIHSGMVFGHPLLKPIDYLTRKHHVHHNQDFGKNYASVTPLPDLLFGTSG